jgi:WD repeat-containing protein 35
MFSFLQKKIAVPSNTQAYSCGWDHYEGWLALGAGEGFLKLIRLEDPRQKQTGGGAAENVNLSNHEDNVKIIEWNHNYRKLTSCDSNGLIIVFMKHNGEWVD